MQSTLPAKTHVAIIMDGNGRWASARGLPRCDGHRAGVCAIRRVVEAAPDLGIGTLTLFAFSRDNWKRPQAEISELLRLLQLYLCEETRRLLEAGVRLTVIGRRDRLPDELAEHIGLCETATAHGTQLNLRIAFDYSARDAIVSAANRIAGAKVVSIDGFARLLSDEPAAQDVDLVIRTSGEQRLSDFLLWESAYAELYFTERLWPDFGRADLAEALAAFAKRTRRFGGLTDRPAA
jgi:undecaprenyl diphosphate synthase